jgi:hypothetical protein
MAIANTAHGNTQGSSTAAITSGAITTTAAVGETIIVAVGTIGTVSAVPTDTASNNYVQLGTFTSTATITLWGCLSNRGASPSITCTFGSSRYSIAIATYTGIFDFIQSNTITGSGTTSPLSMTLPKTLLTNDWALVAYAAEGTGTWALSSDNLRNNIAGAGSTTPGVAILDNTTTTVAATNSSLSNWAGTGLELAVLLVRAYDDDQPLAAKLCDWQLPLSMFRQEDESSYFPPTPFLPTGEYFILADVNGQFWRITINDSGILLNNEILNGPATTFFLNDSAAASTSWQLTITTVGLPQAVSVTYNSGYATQYPMLTCPSGFQTEITIVNGIIVVPNPYRIMNDDDEQYIAVWTGRPIAVYDNSSDDATHIALLPVVPHIGFDDLDSTFHFLEQHTVYDHTSETDEPGGLVAPQSVIDQDSEQSRWFGWNVVYDHTPETDEPGGLAAPPFAIQDGETERTYDQRTVYDATSEADEPGGLAAPPTIDDLEIEKWLGWAAAAIEDDLTSSAPVPPPVIPDDSEVSRWFGHRILFDDSTESDFPPIPPVVVPNIGLDDLEASFKITERQQVQIGDLDSEIGIPSSATYSLLPVVSLLLQDSGSGIWGIAVDNAGEFNSTPSAGTPTTLFLNSAGGSSFQVVVTTAGIIETTPVTAGAYPMSVLFVSPGNYGYVMLVDSAGELGSLQATLTASNPDFAPKFDDMQIMERWVDWRGLQPEDDWTTFPPRPPTIEEISIEEVSEKWVGWSALRPEEIEQDVLPPSPPFSIDQDTEQSKWTGWGAPALEDDHTFAAPTPLSVDDPEIEAWIAYRQVQDDSTESDLLPTPPFVPTQQGTDDLDALFKPSQQATVYDHTPETDEPGVIPMPPTSYEGLFGIAEEEITVGDVMDFGFATAPTFATEDEFYQYWSVVLFGQTQEDLDNPTIVTPPVVAPNIGLDDVEASFRIADRRQQQEEDARSSTPTPPTIDDPEIEKWFEARSVQPDDETLLVVPPAPPPTFQEEPIEKWSAPPAVIDTQDLEGYKTPPPPPIVPEGWEFEDYLPHAQDRVVPVYEDAETQRAIPPPPPTTFTDDGENKFDVTKRSIQYEDTEMQRALPPPPSTVQQTEEAEQKYVDWTARQHEDTDTISAIHPIGPVADDSEMSKWFGYQAVFDDSTESDKQPVAPVVAPNIGLDDVDVHFKTAEPISRPFEEESSGRTPTPPVTQQDEISEKFVGLQQPWHEDTETQREVPPTPPSAIQDEVSERFTETRAMQPEEIEISLPPKPPYVIEHDPEKLIPVPTLVDNADASETTPPPPVVQAEELVDKWCAWVQNLHADEETQQNNVPIPPYAIQDEGELEMWVGWTARLAEEIRNEEGFLPSAALFMCIYRVLVANQVSAFKIAVLGQMVIEALLVQPSPAQFNVDVQPYEIADVIVTPQIVMFALKIGCGDER